MSTQKEYPGFSPADDSETVDFPFHGGGRKGIRHKYPLDGTDAKELVHHVYVSETNGHPSVYLDVAVNFGPTQLVRINPGRPDYSEQLIDRHGERGR